jgi:hypothetical protein
MLEFWCDSIVVQEVLKSYGKGLMVNEETMLGGDGMLLYMSNGRMRVRLNSWIYQCIQWIES